MEDASVLPRPSGRGILSKSKRSQLALGMCTLTERRSERRLFLADGAIMCILGLNITMHKPPASAGTRTTHITRFAVRHVALGPTGHPGVQRSTIRPSITGSGHKRILGSMHITYRGDLDVGSPSIGRGPCGCVRRRGGGNSDPDGLERCAWQWREPGLITASQ